MVSEPNTEQIARSSELSGRTPHRLFGPMLGRIGPTRPLPQAVLALILRWARLARLARVAPEDQAQHS